MVSFCETLRTRAVAANLLSARTRLCGEVRLQARRLQEAAGDRELLAEELRSLQDNQAVLRSNLQVLEAQREAPGEARSEARGEARGERERSEEALLLSSRQRALEGLSLTSQEGAALRQRGFFVEALGLSAGEENLAAGPPESFEAWELAVRRVYEQHLRGLQAQLQEADSRALELHLSSQQHMDLLREREEAKQRLRDEVESKQRHLNSVMEDMATSSRNYTTQIALLTEHTCTLSEKLAGKDASLASLQSHRVLCGHCGMWNGLGKLLQNQVCQTCKEKVLSLS